MAIRYKVKRYHGKHGGYREPKTRYVKILLFVILFLGLGYAGTIIYKPVYDFVMNIKEPQEIIYTESQPENPESSALPEETEPAPKPEPEKLRAVYAPFELVSDDTRFDEFLKYLETTNINAVMVDIKDATGDVLFNSKNKLALEWGVIVPEAIDLKRLSDKLRQANKHLIVKMSVFRDPKAASKGRLDYAINYLDTNYLWLDNSEEAGGKPWLNPYSKPARDYLNGIALEAIDAGAKMLVLENVQFPDNSGIYASFGVDAADVDRAGALQEFVQNLIQLAEEKEARVAVYYSALEITRTDGQDNRYGGSPLKIPVSYMLLGAQPSQFGANYSAAGLEITDPLKAPADAVKTSINYSKQGVLSGVDIIPMLQGGNDAPFNDLEKYLYEQIKAEIAATEELHLQEYVLFNADGEYLLK